MDHEQTENDDFLKSQCLAKTINNYPTEKYLFSKSCIRQWFNIFLFCLFGIMANLHCMQITIIQHILCRYYNVSEFLFNFTFVEFSVAYITLFFPILYLLEKKGVVYVCLIGALCICFGCWFKVISTLFHGFHILFLGQSFTAGGWVISAIIPPLLAQRWFKGKQISFATSLTLIPNNIGILISYSSSIFVKNSESFEVIGRDLYKLFLITAIFCTSTTILIVMFLREDSEAPPIRISNSEVNTSEFLYNSINRILGNMNYSLLCISFGLHVWVIRGISVFLNPIFLTHFKNEEEALCKVGMLIVLSGTVANITFGILQYYIEEIKELLLAIIGLAIVAQIFFAIALHIQITWLVYVTAINLGCFLLGYITIECQSCMEILYPEREGSYAAILSILPHIFEVILLPTLSKLMVYYGEIIIHICFSTTLIISFIIALLNKNVLRKQQNAFQ